MMIRLLSYLLIIFLLSLSTAVKAVDLPIAVIDRTLPYDLSPSNYENSPSNYENSISNYENSSSNYENSESNYENSPSNYNNGRSGDRRLTIKEGSALKFAGYYVRAKNGVTNFFSPSGKRMFYNPKKGRAVFGGKDGGFYGVLVRVNGELSLALTDDGVKLLALSQ